MKFDFFTFGGSVFWEDVFFYQKWRIQRHCFTKSYRLLDSWDIRRASGSFEDCQKSFIKYIECYEITKQPEKMIILLHGYGDGKNIFKRLWRKLILTNSTVAAINYPSLFHNSVSSAHQLLFFLNHAEDISEVSFVTRGAGNLVLQQLFNLPEKYQTFKSRMKVENIVEINPIIKESLICDFFTRFKVFRFVFGPMVSEFTEKNIKRLPSLPKQYKTLKIFSDSIIYQMYLKFLTLCHFPVEDEKHQKDGSLYIRGKTFFTLNNEEVLNNTVKFISNGKI